LFRTLIPISTGMIESKIHKEYECIKSRSNIAAGPFVKIEERNAGGSWSEVRTYYFTATSGLQEISIDFTPTKEEVRLYLSTSDPSNSFNPPTALYFNNFSLTDGTTQAIVDGGIGSKVGYEARIYDASIGRWLATDAYEKLYAPISPYAFALNSPIKLKDADGNVITDGEGNPVTIDVTENKDGTFSVSFDFSEKSSENAKENFMLNGGRAIKTAIQVQTGRDQVEKAVNSKDNIHITITKDKLIDDEGGLVLGKTEIPEVVGKGDENGNLIPEEIQDIEITISEESIKTEQSKGFKAKMSQRGLTTDQGIGTTAAHELEHAVNDIDREAMLKGRKLTSKEHKAATKKGNDAASEFRRKK